jgi:D-amino peptidase
VAEAHAQFRNLLFEQLDRRAVWLRGKPKAYGMLSGLDDATE